MTRVVFFVTDYIFPFVTALATAQIAGLFAWFWFGVPTVREMRDPTA